MEFVVSISGYGPPGTAPVSLECSYDGEVDVLFIAKQIVFTDQRPKNFALITNLMAQTRDFLFTNEHLRDAIRDFFIRMGQELVVLDDGVSAFDPTNKIEMDGIDERGPKYRLAPDITNGHVAVLAAIAFAAGQDSITQALDVMDEIGQLYAIYSI